MRTHYPVGSLICIGPRDVAQVLERSEGNAYHNPDRALGPRPRKVVTLRVELIATQQQIFVLEREPSIRRVTPLEALALGAFG